MQGIQLKPNPPPLVATLLGAFYRQHCWRLVCVMAMLSASCQVLAEVPRRAADVGGLTPATNAGTFTILHDQFDSPSGNGTPDQNFESALDAFDAVAADDFDVPFDAAWLVHQLHSIGSTGNPGGATVSVSILTSSVGGGNPDLPGPPVPGCTYSSLPPISDSAGSFVVQLPSPCLLTAGRYWFQMQTNQTASTHGQHFWSNRSVQTGSEAVWRNPGNGFGSGCTDFRPQTQCGVGGGASPDLLFRVLGEPAGADLAVTISDSPDPVVAGESVEYAIQVRNLGPAPARNTRLTASLAPGVVASSILASDGGQCHAPPGTANVECNWAGLVASSAQRTVALVVRTPANGTQGSVFEATVQTASDAGDPQPGNNTATAQTTASTRADLRVGVQAPGDVIAGTAFQLVANAGNDGPSDATDVSISLTPPVPLQVLAVDGVGATCVVGTVVSCRWTGATPPGVERQMTVQARLAPSAAGTISVPFQSSSATPDPDPSNNGVFAAVPVRAVADVALTVDSDPDPVIAGALWSIVAEAANAGPSDAQALAIQLELPPGAILESSDPGAGGTCAGSEPLVCTWPGSTGAAAARRLAVGLRVLPSVPTNSSLASRLVAVAGTEDPEPGNNAATERVSVQTSADLRFAVRAVPAAVAVGGMIDARAVVENLGSSDAQGVELELSLGPDLRFAQIEAGSAQCEFPQVGLGGPVRCRWPDSIAANGTREVQVRMFGGSAGHAELRGSVSAATPDFISTNNLASAAITIGESAREIPLIGAWSQAFLCLLLCAFGLARSRRQDG